MDLRLNPTLIAATSNSGKIREIQTCLADLGYQVLGLDDLPQARPSPEDGDTFEENARQKAIFYSQFSKHLTLADDSGLEVEALGREPGVRSARFLGETATDEQRYRRILALMESVPEPQRQARFVCCLALAHQGKVIEVFEGSVEGVISREPQGKEGFGYDPIFLLPQFCKTMAELSLEEKNLLSHRGQALRKLALYLRPLKA